MTSPRFDKRAGRRAKWSANLCCVGATKISALDQKLELNPYINLPTNFMCSSSGYSNSHAIFRQRSTGTPIRIVAGSLKAIKRSGDNLLIRARDRTRNSSGARIPLRGLTRILRDHNRIRRIRIPDSTRCILGCSPLSYPTIRTRRPVFASSRGTL